MDVITAREHYKNLRTSEGSAGWWLKRSLQALPFWLGPATQTKVLPAFRPFWKKRGKDCIWICAHNGMGEYCYFVELLILVPPLLGGSCDTFPYGRRSSDGRQMCCNGLEQRSRLVFEPPSLSCKLSVN